MESVSEACISPRKICCFCEVGERSMVTCGSPLSSILISLEVFYCNFYADRKIALFLSILITLYGVSPVVDVACFNLWRETIAFLSEY